MREEFENRRCRSLIDRVEEANQLRSRRTGARTESCSTESADPGAVHGDLSGAGGVVQIGRLSAFGGEVNA